TFQIIDFRPISNLLVANYMFSPYSDRRLSEFALEPEHLINVNGDGIIVTINCHKKLLIR
ncbi:hypothetical protein KJ918_07735, partial [Patescibacteria group bacterium]|nr:hypothetical protein [Patescibacteria group bacterium]